jgi:hypothetical protein
MTGLSRVIPVFVDSQALVESGAAVAPDDGHTVTETRKKKESGSATMLSARRFTVTSIYAQPKERDKGAGVK